MEEISFGQYALPLILMVGLAFIYKIFDKADGTSYIPNRLKPLIAIGLGILLGIVAMFYNGIQPVFKNIVDYVLYGFMAGAGAVGLWEGFSAVKSGKNGAAKIAKMVLIIFLLPAMLMGSLTGCATLGIGGGTTSFDKLTQDEQARVVISATQNGSDLLFDVGRGVMIVKPEYKDAWKLAVVPSFESLNKILLDLETKGAAGQKIDVPAVLTSIQGRVAEIVSLITQYGSIGKTAGSKPTPEDYGLIAILGLSTATVAWNDIVAAMSGQIPTWEVIKARNGILQMKIDLELR